MTRCIVAEDLPVHREFIRLASGTLQPRFYEFRILNAGGQLKWVRGRALAKKPADGSVLWNGMLVDH